MDRAAEPGRDTVARRAWTNDAQTMSSTRHTGAAQPQNESLRPAAESFHAEGVHAVDVDALGARAGAAKTSLYGTFGSKKHLAAVHLRTRDER